VGEKVSAMDCWVGVRREDGHPSSVRGAATHASVSRVPVMEKAKRVQPAACSARDPAPPPPLVPLEPETEPVVQEREGEPNQPPPRCCHSRPNVAVCATEMERAQVKIVPASSVPPARAVLSASAASALAAAGAASDMASRRSPYTASVTWKARKEREE
jgi:hypothetical protein